MNGRAVKRIPKSASENKSLDEVEISDNLSTPVEEEIEKIAGGLTAFSSLANATGRVTSVLRELLNTVRMHEQRISDIEKKHEAYRQKATTELACCLREKPIKEHLKYDELLVKANERLNN